MHLQRHFDVDASGTISLANLTAKVLDDHPSQWFEDSSVNPKALKAAAASSKKDRAKAKATAVAAVSSSGGGADKRQKGGAAEGAGPARPAFGGGGVLRTVT